MILRSAAAINTVPSGAEDMFADEVWMKRFASDRACREFLAAAGTSQPQTLFARSRLPLSTWMRGLAFFHFEPDASARDFMRRFSIHDLRSAERLMSVLSLCAGGRPETTYHCHEQFGFSFRLTDDGERFDYLWGKPYARSGMIYRGIYRSVPFGLYGRRKLIYAMDPERSL